MKILKQSTSISKTYFGSVLMIGFLKSFASVFKLGFDKDTGDIKSFQQPGRMQILG